MKSLQQKLDFFLFSIRGIFISVEDFLPKARRMRDIGQLIYARDNFNKRSILLAVPLRATQAKEELVLIKKLARPRYTNGGFFCFFCFCSLFPSISFCNSSLVFMLMRCNWDAFIKTVRSSSASVLGESCF